MPHPCQDVAQYGVPFPTEAETTGSNSDTTDCNSVLPVPLTAPTCISGSNADVVLASSEHGAVPHQQPKRIIQVHRLNIKKDLIDLFRDPLIMSQDIEIIVIDARGVEEVGRGVGLLRDVFSLSWKET